MFATKPTLPPARESRTTRQDELFTFKLPASNEVAPGTKVEPSPRATADNEVRVSDAALRAAQTALRNEAHARASALKTNLTSVARTIESHQGKAGFEVEISRSGGATDYREVERRDGRIVRRTELHMTDDKKHITFREDRYKSAKDKGERDEKVLSENGQRLELQETVNAGTAIEATRRYLVDGMRVAKSEQKRQGEEELSANLTFLDHAQPIDLPGKLETAFDSRRPILQVTQRLVAKQLGEDKVLKFENLYSQDNVRLTEQPLPGKGNFWLLEKQTGEGNKVSQTFIKGAQESVFTRTSSEPYGRITQKQTLFDTNSGTIGDNADKRPVSLKDIYRSKSTDSEGRIRWSRMHSVDHVKDEHTTEVIRRPAWFGRGVTYKGTRTFSAASGERSEVKIVQKAVRQGEVDVPKETTITFGSHTMSVTEEGERRTFEDVDSATGARVSATVMPNEEATGYVIDFGNARIDLKKDGSVKNERQLEALTDIQLASIPFLMGGHRGMRALAASKRNDAVVLEETISAEILRRLNRGTFRIPLTDIRVGWSVLRALEDIRDGEYVRASFDLGRPALTIMRRAGQALGTFEIGSPVYVGFGVAGAGLQIAHGAYSIAQADNIYDRYAGGVDLAEGGLGLYLGTMALLGTPASPFLLGGLLIGAGADFALKQAKKNAVPALAADFSAKAPVAQ